MSIYLGVNTRQKHAKFSNLVDCLPSDIHEFKVWHGASMRDVLDRAMAYSKRGYSVSIDTDTFYGDFAPYATKADYVRQAGSKLNVDAGSYRLWLSLKQT